MIKIERTHKVLQIEESHSAYWSFSAHKLSLLPVHQYTTLQTMDSFTFVQYHFRSCRTLSFPFVSIDEPCVSLFFPLCVAHRKHAAMRWCYNFLLVRSFRSHTQIFLTYINSFPHLAYMHFGMAVWGYQS